MSRVEVRSVPSADEQQRIREIIGVATEFDGVAPVGEQVLRELGEHHVAVKLHAEIKASLQVNILKKED